MNKYIGMTVNERLYVSVLMDKFDKSAVNKDTKSIISILKEVEITDKSTTNTLLNLGFSINE